MHPTTKLYFDYLQEEGYVPKVDEQNDVVFKQEGKVFVISVDEQDDQFLRVIFPNFWTIENEAGMARALLMANLVNSRIKVGKILIVDNSVMAAAEMFIDRTPELADLLPRTLHILRHTAEAFAGLMREDATDQRALLN